MKTRNPTQWSRLDNAAKIFPANATLRDPKVFRFSCQLLEEVDGSLLQQALDRTLRDFPHYRCVLRRGLFWYFFESSSLPAVVEQEHLPLCSPLFLPEDRGLLFRVSWFRRRISVEVFHALADGTGALQFIRALVFYYLMLVHGQQLEIQPQLDYDASISQKQDDSFQKYYAGAQGGEKKAPVQKAYKIQGPRLSEYRLRTIEGVMSASQVVAEARRRGTSLTAFLGAVLIQAIHGEMSVLQQRRPVVLSIPVNLRNYFDSQSARNFFGLFLTGYSFQDGDGSLEDITATLTRDFREELTAERLAARMNELAALEHNFLTRAVPLVLKDVTLRYFGHRSESQMTAAFSNLGRISMPEPLGQYIDLFSICASTIKLQVCLATFGDRLTVNFTAPFVSTEIQKRFFRILSGLGIQVEISANRIDPEE